MTNIEMKKLWSEHGISMILFGIIIVYGGVMFFKYLDSKSKSTDTMYENTNDAYQSKSGPSGGPGDQPQPTSSSAPPSNSRQSFPQSSCGASSSPAQLLPKDTNSQWAQSNPLGQGSLARVNLLKAGEHIGIDTIGGSLKNANLQLRSEPRIPQGLNTGIWNQSTYEPDLMRLPFEINSCNL